MGDTSEAAQVLLHRSVRSACPAPQKVAESLCWWGLQHSMELKYHLRALHGTDHPAAWVGSGSKTTSLIPGDVLKINMWRSTQEQLSSSWCHPLTNRQETNMNTRMYPLRGSNNLLLLPLLFRWKAETWDFSQYSLFRGWFTNKAIPLCSSLKMIIN